MNGRRLALIVANDEYADPELRRLAAPTQDAAALADALGAPSVGGFDVQVLHNRPAQEVRIAIEEFFSGRNPEDLLLLHFSCHGLKNASGELFLAAADTRPAWLASTGVGADFVNRQMADSRAQRIALLLDCCYGGAFPRGMVVRAAGEAQVQDAFAGQEHIGGGRGRVVVTASSAMEYAFEGSHLTSGAPTPSVFTGAVVDGLTTGEADRDGDGWVGLTELVSYVTDRVRRKTPHQTPQMWTFGSYGELLIARSRIRRIAPTPLPSELVEAMDNPMAAVRFGVVDDLRRRLREADLGQAYAAWQALLRMSEDDSRRVSEVARQGATEAAPKASVESLDLGTVSPGESAEGSFTLAGPPIALTAVAEGSAPWLRVDHEGSAVRVTARPAEAGESVTEVLISGPTGKQTVRIRVRVGAAAPGPQPPPVTHPSGPGIAALPANAAMGAWTPVPPAVPGGGRPPYTFAGVGAGTDQNKTWVWRLVAALIPLLSCGFLAWAVMVFYAVRRRSWILGLAAVGYVALSVLFVILLQPEGAEETVGGGVGIMLWFLTTFGAALHGALLDPDWPPRTPDRPVGL
ncbi:MAG: caspase family protein [Micromonosporaceae bacterium]